MPGLRRERHLVVDPAGCVGGFDDVVSVDTPITPIWRLSRIWCIIALMKIQRVYIDTSVLGGCFDLEFAQWSNRLLTDIRHGLLAPVLSDIVAVEMAEAPPNVQVLYADLLASQAEVIAVSGSALELADIYQQRDILSAKFYNDGLHIAVATVAEVDMLVSWNFKHIVHFDKIRRFNAVNLERGYKPLQIYSPREVVTYDEK